MNTQPGSNSVRALTGLSGSSSNNNNTRRVLTSFSEPGVAMTALVSLVLPIPLLATLNRYGVQYPLDRLHYAMFQLLLLVVVPVIAVVLKEQGDGYRLESVQQQHSPRAESQPRRDVEQSTADSHADKDPDPVTMKGAHKYVDQCTEIERTFMQLATTNDDDEEDRAGSSWVPLTSMKHPYPITVQGHTAKPFCFRIVFYAPTTPATAFDLLASILRRPEWDELTESTRIIEKLGPGDAIHYVKMKPVWPTAARDSLLLSHLTEVRVRGERAYLNVSKSIEDARVPEGSTRGVVRMEAGIAGQLVTRVDQGERQQLGLQGEHWCRVVQIADGDLKGWIPKSVIKFIATQALPRSLKKVCQQLAELPAHDESLILNPNSPPSPQQSQSQQQQQPTVTNTVNGGERQRGAVLQKAMVPMKTKMGRWSLWLRILAQYATPALVAVVTSLVFQIILGRRTGRRFW